MTMLDLDALTHIDQALQRLAPKPVARRKGATSGGVS
jgi:hypothetical protein